jgi:magnesium-transporting ATPase (P-type)
MSVIVKSFLD